MLVRFTMRDLCQKQQMIYNEKKKSVVFPYENRFHQYIDSIKKNTRTIAYDTLNLPCIPNCNMQ